MPKLLNSTSLSALSIVCLHSTMPLVKTQEQEIIKLKNDIEELKKVNYRLITVGDRMKRQLRLSHMLGNRFNDFVEFIEEYGYGDEYDEWSEERVEDGTSELDEIQRARFFGDFLPQPINELGELVVNM